MFLLLVLLQTFQVLLVGVATARFPHHAHTTILNDRSSFLHVVVVVVTLVDEWYGASELFLCFPMHPERISFTLEYQRFCCSVKKFQSFWRRKKKM